MSDLHPPSKPRDPADLRAQIMDGNIAKNDAEWWASKYIAELEAERDRNEATMFQMVGVAEVTARIRAAVLAEREACAKIADRVYPDNAAEVIRARPAP